MKAMEVNNESLLYTMNHDLEENVEEEMISNSTIPFMSVVEEYLDPNIEAPTSSFVHGAITKKIKNTSKKIDKRCKQKILTW